jgi:hypothetical protein
VESRLADLLRGAKASAGIPAAVEERLRGFAERARAGGGGPGALEGGEGRR